MSLYSSLQSSNVLHIKDSHVQEQTKELSNLCFIFTRCIKNDSHKELWKECLKCIRTYYKNEHIVIIDDNSNKMLIESLPNDYNWMLNNVTIIQSEFPGAGEILPYYYFYKLRFAKKAVILHDSMFIQQKIDENIINNLQDMLFLWDFPITCKWLDDENYRNNFDFILYSFLSKLNNNDDIITLYDSNNWKGCFGTTGLVTLNFVDKIQNKYNFIESFKNINNRSERQLLERVISIIAIHESNNNIDNISIFGSIFTHPQAFGYSFENYKYNPLNVPILKCWNSR